MSIPIIVFYHCLFRIGDVEQLSGPKIVYEQMSALRNSGLLDACDEFRVGVNGGVESEQFVEALIPKKAIVTHHGLNCRNELRTLLMLEDWCRNFKPEAYILYFHSKGCTHPPGNSYGETSSKPWRLGMMADLVGNWRQCSTALNEGNDIACSHWMWNMADGTQHIPAGNFLWVKASFVRTLPSIFLRDRLKVSGLDSVESRYEAEVYWGNGPRPNVFQFRPNGGGGVP